MNENRKLHVIGNNDDIHEELRQLRAEVNELRGWLAVVCGIVGGIGMTLGAMVVLWK